MLGFLAVLLIPTGIIHGQNGAAGAQTVTSFESQEDVQKLELTNVRVSLTTEHVTDGKSALEVEFTQPGPASIGLSSGSSPWDWRSFGAIAFDVTNPADKEIGVGIQLSDADPGAGPDHQVSGHGNVGPYDSVSYYYPIGDSSPLEHGMRGGPPMVPGITPVSDIPGSNRRLDEGHITAFKLSFEHPAGVRNVIIDNVRLLPPFNYDGIVDQFGQYTRADWPGKVKDAAGLLAQKQQEEEEIKAHPSVPDRDEYGGWASGPKVAATGFFGTVKREGKWWLVDPDGHLFFSLGIDSISARLGGDASTFVEGRKEMFTWLPSIDDPLSKYYGHTERVVYVQPDGVFKAGLGNFRRPVSIDRIAQKAAGGPGEIALRLPQVERLGQHRSRRGRQIGGSLVLGGGHLLGIPRGHRRRQGQHQRCYGAQPTTCRL